MGEAELVHSGIARLDPVADPGAAAVRILALAAPWLGAGAQHFAEGSVAGHLELFASQGFGQRVRQVEFVQRQNRSSSWLNPEHLWIIAGVGHRKDPAAIGQQQEFRIYRANQGVHNGGDSTEIADV